MSLKTGISQVMFYSISWPVAQEECLILQEIIATELPVYQAGSIQTVLAIFKMEALKLIIQI